MDKSSSTVPSSITLGRHFFSQEEFDKAKSEYQWEQHVPYTVINSVKSETHNSTTEDEQKKIPPGFKWKEATIACKHFGTVRPHKHVEGKAKRPNQKTYKRDCLAKFTINFLWDKKCYEVSTMQSTHRNHELIEKRDLHLHYNEFKVVPPEALHEVSKLFDYEVKRHKIRDVLLANGIKATSQDIQNLRNKWNAKMKGEGANSSEEALFSQLNLLKKEDANSEIVIIYDPDTFVVQSVFFQTSEMKAAHELYPEVLIMDTTYNLCDNNMPLVVYEGIDCYGTGRILGYALIVSEKKELVTAALDLLKVGFPDLNQKVQVVIIDKDQSEVAAIREVLPNAVVHLCDYHVKDAMKRTGFKKLADGQWDVIDPLLKKLIHAYSKEEYDRHYEELDKVVGGPESNFMKYFKKYWHNSELIWTEYRRNLSFSLGERTTGRVESHNARIKEVIDRKLPVGRVISRLRVINRNSNIENDHKLFTSLVKTKYDKYSRDPITQEILRVNTPFVGDLLKRQYERSLDPPSGNEHNVTIERCDCAFFTRFHLLCAHIFRERKLQNVEIYDHSLVPKRWTVVVKKAENKQISCVEIIAAPIKAPTRKKTMYAEDRFNMADKICKRICTMIADCGGKQFEGRIDALLNMEDLYKAGKEVAVVGVNADGHPQMTVTVQGTLVNTAESNQVVIPNLNNANLETHNDSEEHLSAPPQSNKETNQKSAGGQVVTFRKLDSELQSKLKLPPKQVVKGRPKGKRPQPQRERKIGTKGEDDHEDVDGALSGNVCNVCNVCNGPVTCVTSRTKRNYGKRYAICSSRKLPECASFHALVKTRDLTTLPDNSKKIPEGNSRCVVCQNSGPPRNDGAHKCSLCEVPVHAIDGCSVCTSSEVEGYGGSGRLCMKCAGNTKVTDSADVFLKDVVLPTVDIDKVQTILKHEPNVLAEIEFIDLTESGDEAVSPSKSPVFGSVLPSTDNDDASTCISPVFGNHLSTVTEVQPPSLLGSGVCQNIHTSPSQNSVHPSQTISPSFSPVTAVSPPTEKKKICFGCREDAVLRTSKVPRSFGQKFYTCGNPVTEKCKWMNWVKWTRTSSISTSRSISSYFSHRSTTNESNLAGLFDDEGDSLLGGISENVVTDATENSKDTTPPTALVLDRSNITVRKRKETPLNDAETMCRLCRLPILEEHFCICHVCNQPLGEPSHGINCPSCLRGVHKLTCFCETSKVCSNCKASKESGISTSIRQDIVEVKELSDEHMTSVSNMLQEQVGDTFEGLSTPLQVEYGTALSKDQIDFYNKASRTKDYIQILNTGRNHWVTCILKRGSSTVYLLDSNRQAEITGHTKIQIAMCLKSTDNSITIERPPCLQQTNSVDCGLFAIANAIEFINESKIKYTDFDASKMRDHLYNCLVDGFMSPFPRKSERKKKMRTDDDISILKVYCVCRLPENFSDMCQCDICDTYYHCVCENVVANDLEGKFWACSKCTSS